MIKGIRRSTRRVQRTFELELERHHGRLAVGEEGLSRPMGIASELDMTYTCFNSGIRYERGNLPRQ